MTKSANRAAAKAYMEARAREERDHAERQRILGMLETIGPFRRFLIQTRAPEELLTKLDDWVGELTGDLTYLHSRDSSHKPLLLLPHERQKGPTAS